MNLKIATYLFFGTIASAYGETWYVQNGSAGDGRSLEQAFASIQQAADAVSPGDTVIVGPGVYFEHVQIKTHGTAEKPITIRADRIEKNRVIVTGADPAVRQHKIKWTLVDAGLGLYSIPWDKAMPARVLYSGTDLFPYKSVDGLRHFVTNETPQRKIVGPMHGYSVDPQNKQLLVRLYASGRYGPSDPNQQLICIAPSIEGDPKRGELFGQRRADGQYEKLPQSGISITGAGDAHIIVDGITFETPGVAGVYTQASDVTVRNCWFVGCLTGVGGTATYERKENEVYRYDLFANRVVIEYCDFSQFPVYDDGCDTVLDARRKGSKNMDFWQRKDLAGGMPVDAFCYEVGIATLIGQDWIIRRNYIHDAFEGLNERSVTNSDHLQVYENFFDRILDNAVETEDHAANMHIYRNVICDTFGPISWQPLQGKPWPGPIYCYQNILYDTPQFWDVFGFRLPNALKIGATNAKKQYGKDYTPEVSDPGLLFFNNTITWDRGALFWGALWGNNPDKVKLYNNIIVTDLKFPKKWLQKAPYLTFQNNVCVSPMQENLMDQILSDVSALKLTDITRNDFLPLAGSPVIGKAVPVSGSPAMFKDIGALQQGDAWYPLHAGPLVNSR